MWKKRSRRGNKGIVPLQSSEAGFVGSSYAGVFGVDVADEAAQERFLRAMWDEHSLQRIWRSNVLILFFCVPTFIMVSFVCSCVHFSHLVILFTSCRQGCSFHTLMSQSC